jgi:hypothetical protein
MPSVLELGIEIVLARGLYCEAAMANYFKIAFFVEYPHFSIVYSHKCLQTQDMKHMILKNNYLGYITLILTS